MRHFGLIVPLLVTAACGESSGPPPPDAEPPELQIVFPVPGSGSHDRDSNGLVDLELRWSDTGRGPDLASFEVRDIYPAPGGPTGPNLLPTWRVVRLDSVGAVLEETVAGLLRAGYHRLQLRLADRAGNVTTDSTGVVALPPGVFHRAINLSLRPACQPERANSLALSPDGRKGFVPYAGCVAVFDADDAVPVRFLAPVPNAHPVGDIVVDNATGIAYLGGGEATPGFTRLDTQSETVLGWQDVGAGLASVYLHGGRLYAGEDCTNGRVYVFDTATLAELGRLELGAQSPRGYCPNATSFAFTSDGRRGWAAVVDAGVFEFDAQSLQVQQHLDVRPPVGDGNYGIVRSLVLLSDRWLYLARIDDGLDEYDTQTGARTAFYDPPDILPKELALSPDGRLLFASAGIAGIGAANIMTPLLFEVPGLRLRFAFPPRPGRLSDAAVFHPDGRRVFVVAEHQLDIYTSEYEVDVYLVRP